MTNARAPRNFVPVLNAAQKKLLEEIVKLTKKNKLYLPVITDLLPKDYSTAEYSRVLARLYKLEQTNWIVIHRERRRIRGIQPLARP